jgi:hypothetical protein
MVGLPTRFQFGAPINRREKNKKQAYKCEICDLELNSEDTLISHVKGSNQIITNCPVGRRFSGISGLLG